jgi:isocitrate lyase
VRWVEKVAKAQNFQEIVTLQTRFAQDQMQAYATEVQELQRLMGETLQKLQRGSPSWWKNNIAATRTCSHRAKGYEPAFEALPWKEDFDVKIEAKAKP